MVLELLCELQRRGLPIGSVTLIDPAYGIDATAQAAARDLARFFAPASVQTFESAGAMTRCVQREPAAFGSQTTLVHADAADVKDPELKELACACLASGGLAFQLSNDGLGAWVQGGASHHAWIRMGGANGVEPYLAPLDVG